MNQSERLVLTEGQSEHLRCKGVRFAVAPPGAVPTTPARLGLDLIPCDYAAAKDAVAVAIGEKRASTTRTPSAPMNAAVRLVLTDGQSEHLRAAGSGFLVLHQGSYPKTPGRFVLDLIPCPPTIAADAAAVATGGKRAAKPRALRRP